jgi:glycerol-3-phosphate dehydrogenase
MPGDVIPLDILILGGGAAGLWLLDDLTRAGDAAVLLEAHALGSGQTVASQGIIHGGLKYTLSGLLTSSADAIKHLPALWRDCLAGRAKPDLSHTPLRSDFCHLWSTDSLLSRLGKLGASMALQVKPVALPRDEWPPLLAGCPGSVSRLDEQVIVPSGFIADLAGQHRDRILKIDAEHGLRFEFASPGHVSLVHLTDPASRNALLFQPKTIVLAAGQGNADLRARLGLTTDAMQRRPLHVAMARGSLPRFNGHCTDGSKTRVTITTDVDSQGRSVWQVGGQVSEDGVAMDRPTLIAHVKKELFASLPGLRAHDFTGVQWSTYRVDRAEGATRGGLRPSDAVVLREGNIVTCWPTKLVLAPQASSRIRRELPASGAKLDPSAFAAWPRPSVALPPWERETQWH